MDEFLLLGWKIRKLRLERHLTQEAFAHQSGLFDQRSVSDLERGVGNPTLETIVAAATALNVTVGELFSTKDAPPEILSAPTRTSPQP
jgi:transcriptional regulator with XRE-family HTH domain